VKNIPLLIRKDFKRKWKNPVVILGFMLIPLLFTLIFGLVFGSSETDILPRIRVLLVDIDKSLISNFISTAMSQGELKKMIELKPMESEDRARQMLNKGKASAILIIPENFGEDTLDGKKSELLLLKNPSEQFLPLIAEEITDTVALIISSLLAVFASETEIIRGFIKRKDIPDVALSSLSLAVRDKIESISKYAFPPVISLKQETIKEEDQEKTVSLTMQSYILPAMAIMFLLFICNVVFEDILQEKESGTLLRMNISPMTITEFIWSKILTSALIGILCTFVLIGLGAMVFGIKWGNFFSVLLIVLCLNILIAGFISFLYSFVKTENQASALLTSVILVMSLLGGSMIPVANFPQIIQNASKLTVNYWGMEAFRMSIMKKPIIGLMPILFGMLTAGIVLSLISSFFIQNNLKKGLLK
jgi:ABC-2 type transport system permease protein